MPTEGRQDARSPPHSRHSPSSTSVRQLFYSGEQEGRLLRVLGREHESNQRPLSQSACSVDQVPFSEGASSRKLIRIMFLRPNRRFKNGKSTAIGISLRTNVARAARWYSGKCCILARSMTVSSMPSAVCSKPLTKRTIGTANGLCFRLVETCQTALMVTACRCGSMRLGSTGRGSGARAGWHANSISNWNSIGSSRPFAGFPSRDAVAAHSADACATA